MLKSYFWEKNLIFAFALIASSVAVANSKPFSPLEIKSEDSGQVFTGSSKEVEFEKEFAVKKSKSNTNSAKCNLFEDPRSVDCIGPESAYEPNNNVEKWVQNGAIYSQRFVPMLNNDAQFSDYTDVMKNDATSFLVAGIHNSGNGYINDQIQRIPFFAQTSLSITAGGSDESASVSVDSLMKLKAINDDEGDLKRLLFSQAKYTGSGEMDGSTINVGFGLRNRPDDQTMYGGNVFWDHRIVESSRTSHSRIGLGGEYLWKHLELRNNWYIAATGKKDVTVDGVDYIDRVVPGWDVEIGYRIPEYPELGVFVRGFNWDYHHTQDNNGGEVSLNWQASKHVNLEAWVSNELSPTSITVNDDLPGLDEYFVGVRVNFTSQPVVFEKNNFKENIITQMTQPVRRTYDVLIERSTGDFTNRAEGS